MIVLLNFIYIYIFGGSYTYIWLSRMCKNVAYINAAYDVYLYIYIYFPTHGNGHIPDVFYIPISIYIFMVPAPIAI